MPRPYSHILLDADDTLFDFAQTERQALQNTFAAFRLPFDEATLAEYHGHNRQLWQEFEQGRLDKPSVQSHRFERLRCVQERHLDGSDIDRHFQAQLGQIVIPIDGAEELCRRLSPHYSLVIVSNGVASTQHARLQRSPFRTYISHIVISDDVGYQKPDARFFEAMYALIGCSNPQRMLIVGDSLASDMLGGNNAGIDCCWFNRRNAPTPDHLRLDHIIHCLSELLEILGV